MGNKISAIQKARLQQELIEHREEAKNAQERMVIAKEEGDFSENSGLDASRDMLNLHTSRAKEITEILENSEVVGASSGPIIDVGSLIRLEKFDSVAKSFISLGLFLLDSTAGFGILETESPIGRTIKGNPSGISWVQTSLGETNQYRYQKDNSEKAMQEFLQAYPADLKLFGE